MRALFTLLLSSLFSLHAASEELRPCGQPVRYVADWFVAPELDGAKSSAQITALGASGKLQGKGTQLGHVVVETRLSVQPQAACAGVVVRLEFIKPVLRVASEFPADSCAYARVINHEHTHVRIWRDIAARFRQLSYPWPERAKSAEILAHAKRELAFLTRAQEEFDSPEEYGRNQTVCAGEIGRLVKLPGAATGGATGKAPVAKRG